MSLLFVLNINIKLHTERSFLVHEKNSKLLVILENPIQFKIKIIYY